jgi:hypothetical protein
MPIYSHSPADGVGAIKVEVTHVPNPTGPQRIQYVGLGDAAATHRGYLEYEINRSADALDIRTITAHPQGTRLGSLLLYEAAHYGPANGVTRIRALMVAPDARGFYLGAGFHPSAAGRQDNEAVVQTPTASRGDFADRWHLARNTGIWDAQATDIMEQSAQAIEGFWLEQRPD